MQIREGQVAVITGGASGIGLALACRLGRAGVKLVLADIEQSALDAALQTLTQSGSTAIGIRTDVSRADQVERLRDHALDQFGAIDIVCNNAGVVSPFRPMWETTLADWEWVLGVDLWGVLHGIRTFVPLLVAQGHGHVVNTASMAGLIVVPCNGPYNAAKHAVVSMSETLRAELDQEGHNIGVTVVCPGLVATNIDSAVRNAPFAGQNALTPAREKPMANAHVKLDADDVARQIVLAIEGNQLYMVTHEGSSQPIAARLERLVRETGAPL